MPPKARSRAASETADSKTTDRKTINLALQGGGSHGAFTWGVLDRLLEDDRIDIEGVSATSAGAMNATMLAYGHMIGGPEGARRALEDFWHRISDAAKNGPLQPSWLDKTMHNYSLDYSPAFQALDMLSRLFSPYELNPLNLNPLKDVLLEVVDFKLLREQPSPIKLFLSATNVRTGKVKVFDKHELCAEAVLASACLPFMFQAVELNGEYYWDGGYMGNPAIFPVIYSCESRDVVIVHINPLERPELPRTAKEIMNRINEISFNSSLMREMRAIIFVSGLIESGELSGKNMKHMLIHSISADEVMIGLGVNSKLNADWEFLQHLRDTGRQHAEAWLTANYDHLGVKSSVDIRKQYL
ncbi:MAG: patatin-like phospholipase family protein [Aliidongia sp.]